MDYTTKPPYGYIAMKELHVTYIYIHACVIILINPCTRLQITDHYVTLHVLHIAGHVNCGFQIFMSSKERLRVATRRDGLTKLFSKLGKRKEKQVTHISILKLAIQVSVSIDMYIYIYQFVFIPFNKGGASCVNAIWIL